MFSASAAYRVEKCPASGLNGGVVESGEYADKGTAIHEFFDIAKTQGRSIALEKFAESEHYRDMTKIKVDNFLVGVEAIATEVAFALNVYTKEVRYLGNHIERKYPKFEDGSGWIVGSEDVVASTKIYLLGTDMVPVVADLKTGDNVGNIADNLQLGFFALCVHLLTGVEAVEGRIMYTRDNSEDIHFFLEQEHAFDNILARLRKTYDGYMHAKATVAKGEDVPVYPGDHCSYCPHYYGCKKWTGLVKSFMPELEHIQFNHSALTVDKIAELWPKFKQFKKYFEDAHGQIKDIVRKNEGIKLLNGKKLALVPSSREYVNSKRAIGLLKYYGASEEEIEDLFRETKFDRLMEVSEDKPKRKKKNAS